MAEPPELAFTPPEVADAAAAVAVLAPTVESLARALGPHVEVVLHDLTRLPASIVAIAQTQTGRVVGGPPTDLGLQALLAGQVEDAIGYRAVAPSGRTLQSSSVMIHASSGRTVAALCINADVTELLRAQRTLQKLTGAGAEQPGLSSPERFPSSVHELAAGLINDAVSACGTPVENMNKAQRLEVVRQLHKRGFFLLRDAVDDIARALHISRFSVYNYLNETKDERAAQADETTD